MNQPGAEQGLIQFSASFGEQPPHSVVPVQPTKGSLEIEGGFPEGDHLGPGAAESADAVGRGAGGGEDNDGRTRGAEEPRPRVDGSRTAGHDAERCRVEGVLRAARTVAAGSGAEVGMGDSERAGATENGIGSGAQSVELVEIASAAEGVDAVIGCGDAAVGANRQVQHHQREAG